MRKLLIISVLVFPCFSNAQFVNKGEIISLTTGTVVTVGADIDNSGEISNDGQLIALQNWYNRHPAGGFTALSKGIVTLNGGNQAIGGSYPAVFPGLSLSGNGVKKLEQDVEIFQSLSLGDNELSVNTHRLILSAKSHGALQKGNGFISTEEKGYFYRGMEAGSTYIFPMGVQNGGQVLHRPVNIAPLTNGENNIGVSFVYKDPNTSFYNRDHKKEGITGINPKYFHVINRAAGSSPVEIGFSYNSGEEEPFNTLAYWSEGHIWEKADNVRSVANGNIGLDRTLIFTAVELNELPVALAGSGAAHSLIFYNSFTPDGDGNNDTWSIGNIDDYPDNEITIFNRWGGEVFKTKSFSSTNAWDGSKLNDGTYYYLLKVKIDNEYKVFKGFISLLKGQR